MTRTLLPYYDPATNGQGIEGFFNYSDSIVNHFMAPFFLLVFYGLSIYVLSKSEWKMGGIILYTSMLFSFLAWIAQTFLLFNQLWIFVFAIGVLVGIVVSLIENAR